MQMILKGYTTWDTSNPECSGYKNGDQRLPVSLSPWTQPMWVEETIQRIIYLKYWESNV